jgi:hypothetical protein
LGEPDVIMDRESEGLGDLDEAGGADAGVSVAS